MVEKLLAWLQAFPVIYFVCLGVGAVVYVVRNSLELNKLRLEILKLRQETQRLADERPKATPLVIWTPPSYVDDAERTIDTAFIKLKMRGQRHALLLFIAAALVGAVMGGLMANARAQIATSELAAASTMLEDARGILRQSTEGSLVDRSRLLAAIRRASSARAVFKLRSTPEQWARAQLVIGTAYAALDSPSIDVNQRVALATFEEVLAARTIPDTSVIRTMALNNVADLYARSRIGDSLAHLRLAARYADSACVRAKLTSGSSIAVVVRMTRIQIALKLYSQGDTSRLVQARQDVSALARSSASVAYSTEVRFLARAIHVASETQPHKVGD
jgi:hypothetical protein